MTRAPLVLFTLGLIACGVYGAFYFSQIEKAESLINQSIVAVQEGRIPEARELLKEAAFEHDYKVVVGPSLYLLADTYMREGNWESALGSFKILLADKRLGLTDRWFVQSVVATSKLYRRGSSPLSGYQLDILTRTMERVVTGLKTPGDGAEWGGRDLDKEFSSLWNGFLSLGYKLHLKEVAQGELLSEANTELGLLYMKAGDYERAKKVFEELRTPVGALGLAKIYIETGEEIKGLTLLGELIQYDRTGALRAYYVKEVYDYGDELYRNRKFKEAIKVLEFVGGETPHTIYTDLSFYYIALYHYSVKEYSLALKYAQKVLSNDVPLKDEDALMLKGFIYYDERDFTRALKAFSEFIRLYPRSDQIPKARDWKTMCERSIKYLG